MTAPPEAPASTPRASSHLLSLTDPEAAAILRKIFADANYTSEGIRQHVGPEMGAVPANEIPRVLRSLKADNTLSTLILMFHFGVRVEAAALAKALSPLSLQRVAAIGLLEVQPDGMALPRVRFQPFDKALLVSDPPWDDLTSLPPNYVLEVNPTSKLTAAVTPRSRIGSALDVGAGCGVLSILAASHSGRVVATDINSRALNFTAFNAQLNGFANIECAEGSLLEPAAGKTFDLIMSNPPFVISPDTDLQFRDSGWEEDTFCRELIRKVPEHLNEGGIAVVLTNWPIRAGQSWEARPSEWVAGLGCDAVLFRMQTLTAVEYAGTWNRVLASAQPKAYEAALDRWTAYYRKLGIVSIAGGLVVLRRRRTADNWGFSVDGANHGSTSCGDHLLRIIEAQDYLHSGVPTDALLKEKIRPTEELRLEQTIAFRDGRMTTLAATAKLSRGFDFRSDLDPVTWSVLGLCDGRHTLQQVLDELGRRPGVKVDEIRGKVLDAIRNMYAAGFLTRA